MSRNPHYIPKGGMCGNCVHAERDCSHLPFSTMPVISTPTQGLSIVRCAEYVRAMADAGKEVPSDE